MGQFHVYFTPLELDESFGEEIEVTQDVLMQSLGRVNEQLDNTEYDIGVLRVSNIQLTMRNDTGRFSEPGQEPSIFPLIRNGTKVRFTWEPGNNPLVCGFFELPALLSEEITFHRGILSDDSARQKMDDQTITFQILGETNLLDRVSATGTSAISAGDTMTEVLFKLLDQDEITKYLTVNVGNINPTLNFTIDDADFLQNSTGLQGLREALTVSNSVLYIKDSTVYVSPRTPSASLDYSFYGQSSELGAENILDVSDYTSGANRIYNYVTWRDTTKVSQDASSISEYGVYKNEFSSRFITNSGKQDQVLNSIRDEFKDPFIEFKLKTFLTVDTINLFLLDRIQVDHPSVLSIPPGSFLPYYDSVATYDGLAAYPIEEYALTIDGNKRFKIMARAISLSEQTITLSLREFAV
jgi:hypothetical protein